VSHLLKTDAKPLHACERPSKGSMIAPIRVAGGADGKRGNNMAISCVVGDDHEALRRGLVTLLRDDEAIDVIGQAANGTEALGLVERRRPDVLVVDVRMPGIDGIELCGTLAGRDLPTTVVLYTAYDDPETLDAALEAGARGYVLKSSPPQDLVRAIHAVREGRRYVDATLAAALLARHDAPAGGGLSPRELEVLQLLADGHTTDAAAERLFLSPATVRSYAENAMRKLEARNRVHAVATALRQGLIR
jgi:DNA-binding NarL/FixJ family response regulator